MKKSPNKPVEDNGEEQAAYPQEDKRALKNLGNVGGELPEPQKEELEKSRFPQ